MRSLWPSGRSHFACFAFGFWPCNFKVIFFSGPLCWVLDPREPFLGSRSDLEVGRGPYGLLGGPQGARGAETELGLSLHRFPSAGKCCKDAVFWGSRTRGKGCPHSSSASAGGEPGLAAMWNAFALRPDAESHAWCLERPWVCGELWKHRVRVTRTPQGGGAQTELRLTSQRSPGVGAPAWLRS